MSGRHGSAIQNRASFEAARDRLEWVERWLAEGLSAPQVARKAQKAPPEGLGLARTTANRYVGSVLATWQRDATVEPVESKRARAAAFWRGQIERALTFKRAMPTGNGASYELVDAPDLRAANQAGLALMQLEGLAVGK